MNDIYTIKTYRIVIELGVPCFYILNKGLNSGRPMNEPCPNCYIITTETKEERDKLYYLCLALQIGKYFNFYIKGSVIPFITIDDTKKVLNTARQNYKQEKWEFKIEKLKKIIALEDNLKKQLKLIAQLKLALLRT